MTVVPTLEAMARIYRLPRTGGPESERFRAYLAAVRERDGGGLQAFNPMAGDQALATVERLLEVGAEDIVGKVAREAGVALAVVVASPGMWTDRLVTEAEHRLAREPAPPGSVQMWAGEPAETADVRREALAEARRLSWTREHGPAPELRRALDREGAALAASGAAPPVIAADVVARVRESVDVLGDSTARADVMGVAYGDPIAEALGWPLPGLPGRAGVHWAAARARGGLRR